MQTNLLMITEIWRNLDTRMTAKMKALQMRRKNNFRNTEMMLYLCRPF